MVSKTQLEKPPQIRIVVICGPTAVGKTEAAIALATHFGGEIVSADSRQVYRGLDIGTAKPTREQRKKIPHHLIDILNPDEVFSAGEFVKRARGIIASLVGAGKNVFVVGGTGLYIKGLVRGLIPVTARVPELRQELEEEARNQGPASLYRRLELLDRETAATLHPQDVVRVVRALEIILTTSKPVSQWRAEHRFEDRWCKTYQIGLTLSREDLYRRIEERADEMIRRGLFKEVEGLLADGYSLEHSSLRTPGYQEMIEYREGRLGWNEAIAAFKRRTRQYAKRQMTWFRAQPEIRWFEADKRNNLMFQEVSRFLRNEVSGQMS